MSVDREYVALEDARARVREARKELDKVVWSPTGDPLGWTLLTTKDSLKIAECRLDVLIGAKLRGTR
jgi:hypothetical protein